MSRREVWRKKDCVPVVWRPALVWMEAFGLEGCEFQWEHSTWKQNAGMFPCCDVDNFVVCRICHCLSVSIPSFILLNIVSEFKRNLKRGSDDIFIHELFFFLIFMFSLQLIVRLNPTRDYCGAVFMSSLSSPPSQLTLWARHANHVLIATAHCVLTTCTKAWLLSLAKASD